MIAEVDAEGRLPLPEAVRERYGDSFRIVKLEAAVKLLPVPDDPVEDLSDALSEISDVPIEELKEQAEEAAEEDARL